MQPSADEDDEVISAQAEVRRTRALADLRPDDRLYNYAADAAEKKLAIAIANRDRARQTTAVATAPATAAAPTGNIQAEIADAFDVVLPLLFEKVREMVDKIAREVRLECLAMREEMKEERGQKRMREFEILRKQSILRHDLDKANAQIEKLMKEKPTAATVETLKQQILRLRVNASMLAFKQQRNDREMTKYGAQTRDALERLHENGIDVMDARSEYVS